ncbi:permease, partial [Mycobacterium sp.]|uniref:permease n=1 Tax=Mycobacterium sp. TaxID=1785 RepID=UPI002637E32A
GSFWQRLFSADGFTAVAHVFIMEWAAILRDLVLGLLIAGAIGAWVPESFWRSFFLTDHSVLSALWGPIVGPVVAIVSFVCSIGNVPLAAVLWNGGISFGGVIAFIYSDLLILPILNIYRKYYGVRMALVLLGTFFAAMVAAGYVVELLFGATGLIPTERSARVMEAGVTWNYTAWLNIAFLVLAAILVIRFVRTGGIAMLRMMGGSPDAAAKRSHGAGHEHGRRQP